MIFRNLFLLLVLSVAAPAISDELSDRQDIREQVHYLVENRMFVELDAMAEGFRETEARTSSGLWKLAIFYNAFNNTSQVPETYAEYVQGLDDGSILNTEAIFDDYLTQHPDSPTAIIAKAVHYKGLALYFRGSGSASSVSRSGWQAFRMFMNLSNSTLLAGQDIAIIDPHWHTTRVAVLGATEPNSDDFHRVLWDAMQAFPNYYSTYFVAALYSTERWSGDPYLLDKFARFAITRTTDTDGTGLYARIYWSISMLYQRNHMFTKTEVDWDLMRAGIMDVLEDYPDEWNIQNFARFACLADDYKMADELLARMQEEPISSVWRRRPYFSGCESLGEGKMNDVPNWPSVAGVYDRREAAREREERSTFGDNLLQLLFGD